MSRRRIAMTAAGLTMVAGVLAGCSSDSPEPTGSVAARPTVSSSAEPSPSASAASVEGIDVGLPLAWATDGAMREGDGYALTLTETGRTGVYDAHFFHRAQDGAVSGQKFLMLKVTGRDSLEVTWPDGSVAAGVLALAEDGSPRTEIALDPGCLPFLESGSTQLDCRLYPQEEALPSAVPTEVELPVALPGTDDAMGYLCSVDVNELSRVTGPKADPYDTAVLQIALGALGYQSGSIDGRYGEETRSAVLAYQDDAGLAVDGLVGPKTWTSLQADACRIPEDPAQ